MKKIISFLGVLFISVNASATNLFLESENSTETKKLTEVEQTDYSLPTIFNLSVQNLTITNVSDGKETISKQKAKYLKIDRTGKILLATNNEAKLLMNFDKAEIYQDAPNSILLMDSDYYGAKSCVINCSNEGFIMCTLVVDENNYMVIDIKCPDIDKLKKIYNSVKKNAFLK